MLRHRLAIEAAPRHQLCLLRQSPALLTINVGGIESSSSWAGLRPTSHPGVQLEPLAELERMNEQTHAREALKLLLNMGSYVPKLPKGSVKVPASRGTQNVLGRMIHDTHALAAEAAIHQPPVYTDLRPGAAVIYGTRLYRITFDRKTLGQQVAPDTRPGSTGGIWSKCGCRPVWSSILTRT